MTLGLFIHCEANQLEEESTYYYALSGEVVYQIGSVLPVITKGKECIGLGKVTKVESNGNVTKVFFTFYETTRENKKAYYSLYTSNAGNVSEPEHYEEYYVPGVFSNSESKSPKSKSKRSSLYDYMD